VSKHGVASPQSASGHACRARTWPGPRVAERSAGRDEELSEEVRASAGQHAQHQQQPQPPDPQASSGRGGACPGGPGASPSPSSQTPCEPRGPLGGMASRNSAGLCLCHRFIEQICSMH